jgi:glutathione S-transferase
MTLTLYGSWFSPFARKVALALELKGLDYEHVDALTRAFHAQLLCLNPRGEVPVLTDNAITVVNSSDILQYLERRCPEPALYPVDDADRVTARALERLADHRLDPVVVCSSLWHWADRRDEPPPQLRARAQLDFETILSELEQALQTRSKPWPFGAPGVVECSLYPNLLAAPALGLKLDRNRFPNVHSYLRAMREHPVFAEDALRTARFLKALPAADHERSKIFWSGDRIEWLLSRGLHAWLYAEIEAGRATFPA